MEAMRIRKRQEEETRRRKKAEEEAAAKEKQRQQDEADNGSDSDSSSTSTSGSSAGEYEVIVTQVRERAKMSIEKNIIFFHAHHRLEAPRNPSRGRRCCRASRLRGRRRAWIPAGRGGARWRSRRRRWRRGERQRRGRRRKTKGEIGGENDQQQFCIFRLTHPFLLLYIVFMVGRSTNKRQLLLSKTAVLEKLEYALAFNKNDVCSMQA